MKHLLRDAQEESTILLGSCEGIVFFTTNFDNIIGSQVKHQLIFSKEGVTWKLEERCNSFLVIKDCCSSRDEIHFSQFLPVRDDGFTWFVDSAIHVYNELVLKSYICV